MTSNVSRLELWFRGLGYLVLGLAGPWVFINPPQSFPGGWGLGISLTWGLLIMTSFIAGIASFMGRYRVEMIVLPFIIAALLGYSFSIMYLVSVLPSRGSQALTLLAFALILAGRYVRTMILARQPSPHTESLPIVSKGQ